MFSYGYWRNLIDLKDFRKIDWFTQVGAKFILHYRKKNKQVEYKYCLGGNSFNILLLIIENLNNLNGI